MKIFNQYKTLLNEETSVNAIEACKKAFGNELFATPLGGSEPNTRIEDKYVQSINRFTKSVFGSEIAERNPSFIAAMKNLKTCMSVYPEVLVPEGIVYRGERLSVKDTIDIYTRVHGKPAFKFPYKAKTFIQSWTEDKQTGVGFALNQQNQYIQLAKYIKEATTANVLIDEINKRINFILGEGHYDAIPTFGFLLTHEATPDQFLFKAKYFSKISDYDDEQEIIRLGLEPLICNWSVAHPMIFTVLIPYLLKHKDELKLFK